MIHVDATSRSSDPSCNLSDPAWKERTGLVFALHFHQPYGNLDEVFADAMDRCYLPTLALLKDTPHIKTAIHVSGCLLDWAEAHRPAMLEALSTLVARGQIEILGGGYQEPMLAILPDRDAVGQLSKMRRRCKALVGAEPTGMWLTERVWEPDLPRPIAESGYRYTLLDDSHLHAAGAADPLGAYYVTDKAGASLAVFPIDRGLRTRVPYADVEELIDYLRGQKGRIPTYGDDVEKFGLWPTTERRVWTDKWLERFFAAIERESDWLRTVLPRDVLATKPSSGAIYIPTISYQEMGAWALPSKTSNQYDEVAERMQMAGYDREVQTFLRGGIWQAFLAKYPESNLIYRKMLRVSGLVAAAKQRGDANAERAEDALYQGQCNCAYWHGLFGGLYLQHLRAALMGALIEAEVLADPRTGVRLVEQDHDGDLVDELLFETPALNLYVSPARGGSALELDLLAARYHLTGVLGRRLEAYHRDVPRAQVISDEELGNISAHDLVRATEEGLEDKLVVDAYPRGAFIDHLLAADATPAAFGGDYAPIADLSNARYRTTNIERGERKAIAELAVDLGAHRLAKTFEVSEAGITVRYALRGDGGAVRFASQVDVTLLSPERVGGRAIEVDAKEPVDPTPGHEAVAHDVTEVRVLGESMGVAVRLRPSPGATLWRLPIETVSQSERGFERAYQGTSLVFVWDGSPDADAPLEAELSLEVITR
jgi:4-alpha-glucanotransferase